MNIKLVFSNICLQGFLLSVENFNYLKLQHGLMEAGYLDHEESVISESDGALSISMTATIDASGNLLIGNRFTREIILHFMSYAHSSPPTLFTFMLSIVAFSYFLHLLSNNQEAADSLLDLTLN